MKKAAEKKLRSTLDLPAESNSPRKNGRETVAEKPSLFENHAFWGFTLTAISLILAVLGLKEYRFLILISLPLFSLAGWTVLKRTSDSAIQLVVILIITVLGAGTFPLYQYFSIKPRPYDLSSERRSQFLKLLSAQTQERDTLRIGCVPWSGDSCVAAGNFLTLFSDAGWKIDENKVFTLELEAPVSGIEIATGTYSNITKERNRPPHPGHWRKLGESSKTISVAFRQMDVTVGSAYDETLGPGTIGIYFGPEPN